MSFSNRQEDIDKILSLKDEEEYQFNIFQEGGACVTRVGTNYELEEITTYGVSVIFDCTFETSQIKEVVDRVYDEWT